MCSLFINLDEPIDKDIKIGDYVIFNTLRLDCFL